jgi:SpoVK/Ycf46/Vps4 family AAA+-type ATPase
VPALTYGERLAHWQQALPSAGPALPELARRFRYEQTAIARVGRELAALDHLPTINEMLSAARADLDLGTLAQAVAPRFALGELMLPAMQAAQIDEIVAAVNNLTRVHYEWGTARAWNEGGLTALFAGPPGTGKTMAAEAIATELNLPLYRIDLSQVVNKYIGETEKNLRRVFDATEDGGAILFFDEADALFGKRTEIRDAHDKYANQEVAYLLQRIESYNGLVILASNQRGNIDDAFVRRLQTIIHFPVPRPEERYELWRKTFPSQIALADDIDWGQVAARHELTGAAILNIAHFCAIDVLARKTRQLDLQALEAAIRREYVKEGKIV